VSAEAEIYAALSGNAPLVALVGARIYPDAMPEETEYPAIVYSRGATEPIRTIHGSAVVAAFVDVSVSCWGNTRTQADLVATGAIAAIEAAGETWTGRASGYDTETDLYATTIEVTVLSI